MKRRIRTGSTPASFCGYDRVKPKDNCVIKLLNSIIKGNNDVKMN